MATRRGEAVSGIAEVLSGRFELKEKIGSGGMATVWRVLDLQDGAERALKLLHPHASGPKARRRFIQEAQTMASLEHPNILRVTHICEEEGQFYFVMALARHSLAGLMKERRRALGVREAVASGTQVLRGLQFAHDRGVVHRDIKPANILVGPKGRVLVADFGIARLLDASMASRITGTDDTLGTLAYMAPEQRMDPRRAGPASDIYAAGTTLYYLVTGRRPLDLTLAALDPAVMGRVPLELRHIVSRATAVDTADRWESAGAMADALETLWGDLSPEVRSGADPLWTEEDGTVVLIAGPGGDAG